MRFIAQTIAHYQYCLVAVGLSGILKLKQKLGVTFNFNKQDIIDFTKTFKNDNVHDLRSKFIKVVVDPLFFGQKIMFSKFYLTIKFSLAY